MLTFFQQYGGIICFCVAMINIPVIFLYIITVSNAKKNMADTFQSALSMLVRENQIGIAIKMLRYCKNTRVFRVKDYEKLQKEVFGEVVTSEIKK